MVAVHLACLSNLVLAYDKNNRLADYYDKIQIYNSTAPNVEVYSDKLYAFPYVANVSSFTTTHIVALGLPWF